MLKSDARRLADALGALVGDHVRAELGGNPFDTRNRILTRLTRHLPLDGAEKASEFAPPMWTLGVARKAGLPRAQALALAVVGTTYFSTADLADDIADGDLVDDIGLHVTDVCRLTFLYQQAIGRVPDIDDGQRHAMAETLARHGQDMADGQELDLRSTGAMHAADPVLIPRHKSGCEFAALAELIAIVGGFDRPAWRAFGAAFGTAAQITSDYFDLFLDPDSDDWAAGKPTLPIRRALADADHGAAVHALLAGRRTDPERKAAGLWHLVQAGAADALRAVHAELEGEMDRALAVAGHRRALRPAADAVAEVAGAIAEALDEYRGDPRPDVPGVADERRPCIARALGFLGGVGPPSGALDALIVAEAMLDAGHAPDRAALGRLLDTLGDGARRHADRTDLPPDADATGRILRLAAAADLADHPAVPRGVDALLAHTRRDGLVHTWLTGRARWPVDPAELPGPICPVTVAVALHGLWSVDPALHRKRVLKGASVLAVLLERGPPQCRSAFYRQALVEDRPVRLLLAVRPEASRRDREAIDRALAASAARSAPLRRLDGRFGDTLGTAVRAGSLLELEAAGLASVAHRDAIARALVDAASGDGGYPADRCFRAPDATMHYDWTGTRRLTTALVHRTLTRLDVPPDDRRR